MTVLVSAASKHGATAEIAARIGGGLAEHGVAVDVMRPEEVHDLEGYDAFVVGSALYMGRWLKEATTLIDAHSEELSRHPTWLFSSGPIADPSAPADPFDSAQGNALAETLHAREHRVFAGKLDTAALNLAERAIVRIARSNEGDQRDWHAIDEWAAGIARALQAARVTAV
jgi:menaquinone-dependent protoporphyrinogen oxidase